MSNTAFQLEMKIWTLELITLFYFNFQNKVFVRSCMKSVIGRICQKFRHYWILEKGVSESSLLLAKAKCSNKMSSLCSTVNVHYFLAPSCPILVLERVWSSNNFEKYSNMHKYDQFDYIRPYIASYAQKQRIGLNSLFDGSS